MSEPSKIEDEIVAILTQERWPPLDQDAKQDDDLLPTWAIIAILFVLLIAIIFICAIVWRIVL